MIISSILPTFTMIALGSLLKRLGLIDHAFLKTSDKIVYFIFFPALLFWKIGTPSGDGGTEHWSMIGAVLCAVSCVAVLSVVYAYAARVPRFYVGSFSQASFRFSTYVGIAVVLGAYGEEGVRQFGVVIGFVIPIINVMCVTILIWFSERNYSSRDRYRLVVQAMWSNPLIWACVAGVVYSRLNVGFPAFLDRTLALMSSIAVPLALLSIGASLTFGQLRGNLRQAAVSQALKLVLMPLIGYCLLRVWGITGLEFQVAMVYFALPTSPATYILSSQLDSDLDLASASIVLSTLLSTVSLAITLALV
ncbi:MAG: AEC family transporter [Thermodesulfobacteriota bacterium]